MRDEEGREKWSYDKTASNRGLIELEYRAPVKSRILVIRS
jgi:hypothetical protein